MYTLEANLIDPNTRKSRITCSKCDLTYKARNYFILYESHKLAYFKFKPIDKSRWRVFCHDCMHRDCLRMARDGYVPLQVEMHTLEGVIHVTIITDNEK